MQLPGIDWYLGATTYRKLVKRVGEELGGMMVVRGRLREVPPYAWAFDNGAYQDWRAGRDFDRAQFVKDLETILGWPESRWPDFVVLPDVITGGVDSLRYSLAWLYELPPELTWYVAVQDGMTPEDVSDAWELVSGIFVGGSLEWKLESGRGWARAAHEHGVKCHIGRVGTPRRVRWARSIEADSIDSATPCNSERQLNRWLDAIREEPLFPGSEETIDGSRREVMPVQSVERLRHERQKREGDSLPSDPNQLKLFEKK